MTPISVIIPAYNESKSIREVVRSLESFMVREKIEHEIIVVDDHSTDDTAQNARGAGTIVIMHPVNRGYGSAITTGLKRSKYEHVLIIDADDTYPVEEIKNLLPYASDFDMVVGARQGKHYHGSLIKRISRTIFYLLLGYVTGEKVPDANSGLRIFKKSVVMRFEDDFCSGFSFTTTITIILLSNRYLIKFVPIGYLRRSGKSKVRHIQDAARTFQILLQTITYYNPIKAFLPFSILSFFLFVLFSSFQLFRVRGIHHDISAVIFLFSSMFFMGLGMISYVIVKGKRVR